MRKRFLALPVLGLAAGLVGIAPAYAHDHGSTPTAATPPAAASSPNGFAPRFFLAVLAGRNEVPVPGGPAVGDPDATGAALVRVQGARVTFAVDWRGMTAPTLGHIHQGAAGVNGPVQVALFGTAMPVTATAAAGATTVTDPKIADGIRANPAGFYVNLHSAEFPGGAVRGQLVPVHHPFDVLSVIQGGRQRAYLSGDQEVPVANGPAVGDPDGRAVAFIRARGERVSYSLAWIGVTPTLGHIHQGAFGANGPVKVPLFTTPVPATIFALSGTVSGVDAAVVAQLRSQPRAFYANLHTAEFPGGAVRGQIYW